MNTNTETIITAINLRPGTYVADDFTAWARADAITKLSDGFVRILWTLANGTTETVLYTPGEKFTIINPDTNNTPETIIVICEECGERHFGEKAHVDQYNGMQLYAVTCPVDYLTDYFNLNQAIETK